jgi:hypothetical protein
MAFDFEAIKEATRYFRPHTIEDLWRDPRTHSREGSPRHIASQNIDWWASSQEIPDFLNDETRVRQMKNFFVEIAIQVGQVCQQLVQRFRLDDGGRIFVCPNCSGCNNLYDTSSCVHPNSPTCIPMMDPQVLELVHKVVIQLSAISFLIVEEHKLGTTRLASILAP